MLKIVIWYSAENTGISGNGFYIYMIVSFTALISWDKKFMVDKGNFWIVFWQCRFERERLEREKAEAERLERERIRLERERRERERLEREREAEQRRIEQLR